MSRVSAQGVIKALEANYKQVLNVELDQNITSQLSQFSPDVVFPVLHGPPGEDGTLQGFLEILGYRYVGSDVHSSSAAMDKVLAKLIFREANLPLAKQVVIARQDDPASSVGKIVSELGSYVVVKPVSQGSAVGVTLVNNQNELEKALTLAATLDDYLLVEERIEGKEITVGIIDTDDGPAAFPVIDIVTAEDAWYDFEHRYTKGLSEHIIPADLSKEQTRRLQQIAIEAHVCLGCRDLSRADFIVPDSEHEILLEVNTLPGMTPTSLYPDGALTYGLDFEALVSCLVERAALR